MVVEPMVRRPARADGRTTQRGNGPGERTSEADDPEPRGRRALIVDDEPDIVDILASLLEDVGWTPLPAFGPEDALRIAAAGPIDLLMCDICMPRMDGIELLRRMRLEAMIGDAPVVLMSAARRIEPHGTVFLAKPFDLDEVVSLLDRLVAG
ncbi:MAG TPA: response regulator [Thermomicrobiales bacterium]|nr:response regulator [Thermomicrobiales bacterium]